MFKKVVYGTADDGVLSKSFGLDGSRSDRAARVTAEWSTLRAQLARRELSAREKQRMRDIEKQLPLSFEPAAAE